MSLAISLIVLKYIMFILLPNFAYIYFNKCFISTSNYHLWLEQCHIVFSSNNLEYGCDFNASIILMSIFFSQLLRRCSPDLSNTKFKLVHISGKKMAGGAYACTIIVRWDQKERDSVHWETRKASYSEMNPLNCPIPLKILTP